MGSEQSRPQSQGSQQRSQSSNVQPMRQQNQQNYNAPHMNQQIIQNVRPQQPQSPRFQPPSYQPPMQQFMPAQQYQQMYRRMTNTEKELKDFKLLVYLHKDSVKVEKTNNQKISISFKIDALCDFYLRVNACVTEQRDANNVPQMLYTPNKENYVQEMRLKAGMNQDIGHSQITFDLNHIEGYELFKNVSTYYPIIMSVNYSQNGKPYAFINYGVFTKNSQKEIEGIRIIKQLVLINGIPFEIKSIYGLEETHSTKVVEGEHVGESLEGVPEDGEGKECLICLSEERSSVIMPCGHLCVCKGCGDLLQQKGYTCPICRGIIGSIIPFNQNYKANHK